MSDVYERITFRVETHLSKALRAAAEAKFGGNVSKLINQSIATYLQTEGLLSREVEIALLAEEVKSAQEQGIDVRGLIREALSQKKVLEVV